MELKKAFEKALEFEKKGYDIYKERADKTQNPIVKRTFNYLASQEQYHIQEIKEYIEKLQDGHGVELKGDTLEDTKKFFSMTVKDFHEKLKLSDDDVKAYEAALHLEKKAYNFYEQKMGLAQDSELRKFFEFLMEQENAHYEFIQKSLEFSKDPANFYTEEEGWIMEG